METKYTSGKQAWNHYTSEARTPVKATPEQVWEVLNDFGSYPQWTKFMRNIQGDIKHGPIKIDFALDLNYEKYRTFVHKKPIYEEGKIFGWSDPMMPGLADHHLYEVRVQDGETVFVQSDVCKGFLAPLMKGMILGYHQKMYPVFNEELKAEVERRFA